MPWKEVNQILGLACIDPEFWKALQKDPCGAIRSQEFELTPEEMALFDAITTDDLDTFCQSLIEQFAPDHLDLF